MAVKEKTVEAESLDQVFKKLEKGSAKAGKKLAIDGMKKLGMA